MLWVTLIFFLQLLVFVLCIVLAVGIVLNLVGFLVQKIRHKL
jgi:hypothetical protein